MAQAWRPASRSGLGADHRWLPWLTEKESLTARLIGHYGAVTVRVLRQGLAVPHRDESLLIGQRAGRLAWVREVLLCAQGRPLVYARSVLARAALRGDWHRLANFGSRPLGAALFADPLVRREHLFVRRLDERDWRYARAVQASGEAQSGALWARRSRFVLGAHGLVVCEVFLAGMDAVDSNR